MHELLKQASNDPNFVSLLSACRTSEEARFNVSGLFETQKYYLVAALAELSQRTLAIILDNELTVKEWQTGLTAYWPAEKIVPFLKRTVNYANVDSVSQEDSWQQIASLNDLLKATSLRTTSLKASTLNAKALNVSDKDLLKTSTLETSNPNASGKGELSGNAKQLIVLIDAQALLEPILPPIALEELQLKLKVGQTISPNSLVKQLVELGFKQVSLPSVAGEFAKRGDIIDLITTDSFNKDLGLRISFFDIEIDQIKYYKLANQRACQQLNACEILPVKSFCIKEKEWQLLSKRLQTELASYEHKLKLLSQLKQKKTSSRSQLEGQIALLKSDLAKIGERLYFPSLEAYLALIYPEDNNLFAYLNKLNAVCLTNELVTVNKSLAAYSKQLALDAAIYLEQARTLKLKTDLLPTHTEIMALLDKQPQLINLACFQTATNGFVKARQVNISGREAESLKIGEKNKSLVDKIADFASYQKEGYKFYAFAPTEKQANDLKAYLNASTSLPASSSSTASTNVSPTLSTNATFTSNSSILWLVKVANLKQGFNYPAAKILLFGQNELLQKWQVKQKSKSSKKDKTQIIDFFNDLKAGDYVVHEIHGIGLYRGIKTVETAGIKSDYLYIEYAGSDVLYLPMSAVSELQKYIGNKDTVPRLSHFGGQDWEKLKERSRAKIRELATNLLDLYAKRRSIKGFSFPKSASLEQEFASTFPYVETNDQLQAWQDVEQDMQAAYVMDRIICGDVGFGKTEIAFRACFKAILACKQVAFIAPTTVLVEQHYENFLKRVKEWPINVGLLSRFSSPLQEKRVLKELQTGNCEIVFGTHRILSKDVKFKDLGLLVIDEEQRFGVDHKEQLKERYPQVDVLTLSATPIPRTLHMALSGIRSISTLQEAPLERKAVKTYVLEYDKELLKAAIIREKSRGGQVFYLHNNTKTIYKKQAELQALLPNLKIAVAHGKLGETELETEIFNFVNGESDVLLCTTIIESGIDMPNVNTLIIEDADRLGLAQLYQLKGRVGRSSKQAYAYITYKPDKLLTEEASKRIKAISAFTELGSGLKIALQDLEVRGAGNIIGAEQHGQIAAVGYDMYCRMLDEELQLAKLRQAQAQAQTQAQARAQVAEQISATTNSVTLAPTTATKTTNTLASDYLNSQKCQINLKLNAYIERELVSLESERIELYRRISQLKTYADYLDLSDEICDRFGDLTANIENLLDIAYVRSSCTGLGISEINSLPRYLELVFKANRPLDMQKLSKLMDDTKLKRNLHFIASEPARIELDVPQMSNESERLRLLRTWLIRSLEHS